MSEMIELSKAQPKVGIIMGSESDLYVMREAAKVLQEMCIEFEVNVVSAHSTPNVMYEYSKTAGE